MYRIRNDARSRIARQVELFLARGGKITHCPPGARAQSNPDEDASYRIDLSLQDGQYKIADFVGERVMH